MLILIEIGIIVYKLTFKLKSIPGLGWLETEGNEIRFEDSRYHEFTDQRGEGNRPQRPGIEFNPSRYHEFTNPRMQFLRNWKGSARIGVAKKAFSNQMVIQDIKQFNSKHFSDMMVSAKGNINWSDERIQLFLEVMRQEHYLKDRAAIALLLYINNEVNYQNYSDNFREADPSDYTGLMREIVLHDIYNERNPNFRYIRRLVDELGIPRKQARRVKTTYAKIKKELKVSQFAKSLHEDDKAPYIGVEKQIKSEIQLAAINERIGSLLDISPKSYHIVGRDYSRDSRIDNYYRRHFSSVLSRAFDGHCCKCGEGMQQLEFDHFWLPKSSGGNFLMRSKSSGLYVNNCIPLCRSCNSSKGHRDFREFFTEEELEEVIKRSRSIETYINQHMVDFDDPDFPNRAY